MPVVHENDKISEKIKYLQQLTISKDYYARSSKEKRDFQVENVTMKRDKERRPAKVMSRTEIIYNN